LIYPTHFHDGYISYPKNTKKCQAIVLCKETTNLVIPNEHYVLIKRVSAKDEKKRVVAVVYDSTKIDTPSIGFENHLNYFHQQGHGLDLIVARGLTAYLNSSLVDAFFRLFNGHTQVNATVKIHDAMGNLVSTITHGNVPMLQKIKKLLKGV
jgi:adenine-specific DNA-methyltransferase